MFLAARPVGMPLRHIWSTVVDISVTFLADKRNRFPNAASCAPITEAAFRFLLALGRIRPLSYEGLIFFRHD